MLLHLRNEKAHPSSVSYVRTLLKFEALIVSFKVFMEGGASLTES
jgi:hypothetical protein